MSTIDGNASSETITGTLGDDVIAGEGGNDRIDGAGGNDVICGGDGNDKLTSAGGVDSLDGGPGNDGLTAGAGDDVLLGGPDDDRLLGEAGIDSLIGGPGDDRLDGGVGLLDQVLYQFSGGPVDANLATGVSIGEGTDQLLDIEQLVGSNFDDTLTGNAMSNKLIAMLGDDVIAGREGDDFIDGGEGTDLADGGSESDTCVAAETTIDCEGVALSIATVDAAGDVGVTTSIAIGADRFPVISYYDATNGHLKVAHCTTASCEAIDPPTTVDTAAFVGLDSSIAIGDDGFPVISYFDAGNRDLKVVHCRSVSCSAFDPPTTVDAVGEVGLFTSIAIGVDRLPVISYYDLTNGDLKVAHCKRVTCSALDSRRVVDAAPFVGLFTSIAIGADGFPVISYWDGGSNHLKVVHCTTVKCKTFDPPTTVDGDGDYTSIAIGVDGLPVVSYRGFLDLKVAHCRTASCSAFDPPTIVDTGADALYTSIAVGADRLPVISYHDRAQFDLKVAHCTTASCSTFDPPTTVDVAGAVGAYTSIAIGDDRIPVISYYDDTNDDLRVARVAVS